MHKFYLGILFAVLFGFLYSNKLAKEDAAKMHANLYDTESVTQSLLGGNKTISENDKFSKEKISEASMATDVATWKASNLQA